MTSEFDRDSPGGWGTEESEFLEVLSRVAPGTGIRVAVDRIIRQGNGALVVIGSGPRIERIAAGGFELRNTPFTPAMVAELAKMDGAIILDGEATRILRANVHMLPDPAISTDETGARFRTAERLARSTGCPVIAVSEERRQGIVFFGDRKQPLQSAAELMLLINQELHTLERFRGRLAEAEEELDELEVSGRVTIGAALTVLQRAELMRRIGIRVETLAVGLGEERQMVELQLSDIMEGVTELGGRVSHNYFWDRGDLGTEGTEVLRSRSLQDLHDTERLCRTLGIGPADARIDPVGRRLAV